MKFNENLQKLRKAKGLSQESLAEKLGVTRQSVSKWESGVSYPEMDKLISMCSIFDCSMDYLLNGKDDKTELKEKITINSLVNELVDSVQKTVKMLSCKSGKEIIKFILEIIVILFIIYLFEIPVNILENLGSAVLLKIGVVGDVFNSIWVLLLQLAYFILAVLFFITIYKTRYLDKIDVTKNLVLKEENITEDIEINKENIQKNGVILSFLSIILMYFIKFIVFCILIGFAIECICAIIMFSFSIIIFIKGVHLIGPIIALLGLVLFSIVISEILFNFIVNRKTNMKKSFISFVISFLFMGFGIGMSIFSFSEMTYINGVPKSYKEKIVTEEIDMHDDLIFDCDLYSDIEFIKNDNLENIKVEIDTYDKYETKLIQNDNIISLHTSSYVTGKEKVKEIITNLKENKIYDYNIEHKIKVYASSSNIDKLKQNTINNCESEEDYIETIENEINDLNEENENLKEENNQLKEQYKELKNNIKNALNE